MRIPFHLALPDCWLFKYSLWLCLLLFYCGDRKLTKSNFRRKGLLGVVPEGLHFMWGQGPWQQECEAAQSHGMCKKWSLPVTNFQQGSISYRFYLPKQCPGPASSVQTHGPWGAFHITTLVLLCIPLIRNDSEVLSHI